MIAHRRVMSLFALRLPSFQPVTSLCHKWAASHCVFGGWPPFTQYLSEADFYMCIKYNIFPFVIQITRDEYGFVGNKVIPVQQKNNPRDWRHLAVMLSYAQSNIHCKCSDGDKLPILCAKRVGGRCKPMASWDSASLPSSRRERPCLVAEDGAAW